MKRMLDIIITLVIAGVLIVLGALVWTNYLQPVNVPEISSTSNEFGTLEKGEEVNKQYEVYSQKLNSNTQVDTEVNTYINDSITDFIKENSKDDKILNKDKPVFKNIIDTYKVNDNLVSIRITTVIKKVYEEDFNTSIKAFNYNTETQTQVTLDELFKSGYKEKLGTIYTDSYLLNKKQIEFYNGEQKTSCTYNSLKEYAYSKSLTAQNYDVTEDEYQEMFAHVVDKTKKMVAITLDDGPHATNTQKILDILEKNNARATFFMLGQNVVNNKDVVKDVYDRGNEIGIHTWDHKQLTKLTAEEIVQEVESTSDAIYEITGERPKLVRPPYGAVNSTVKSALDYPLILWNIDSLDWKSRDENQIVPLVMNSVQDGDIILLHDIHSTTVPAVEKIVEQLAQDGYQLVTVSQMLEAKGYDLTTTKVFYSGRQ